MVACDDKNRVAEIGSARVLGKKLSKTIVSISAAGCMTFGTIKFEVLQGRFCFLLIKGLLLGVGEGQILVHGKGDYEIDHRVAGGRWKFLDGALKHDAVMISPKSALGIVLDCSKFLIKWRIIIDLLFLQIIKYAIECKGAGIESVGMITSMLED